MKCIIKKTLIVFAFMLFCTHSTQAFCSLPQNIVRCDTTRKVQREYKSPKTIHQFDIINHNSKLNPTNYSKSHVADTWIYNFTELCSQIVCTAISKVTFPHSQNDKLQKLLPYMKKWDIVCIKTTYRLSNYLIPGYFGHAAIYLGNNTFAHCDLKGVRYSPITEFTDGDSYILLRPKKVSNKEDKNMYVTLNGLVGSKYDYNFNINTPDRLICTELIYLIYSDYQWTTDKLLLWETMSPDEIVLSGLNEDKIEILYFITEQGMIKNPSHKSIKELFEK